jgi:uncharacterized protein (DUF427 family)
MDHPARAITVKPFEARVRVRFAGEMIADSGHALLLEEETHDPVLYLPKSDVRMDLLVASDRSTHCPWKGDARYWTIRAGGRGAQDAVWAYDTPLAGVAAIAGHVAFYATRVDAIEVADS